MSFISSLGEWLRKTAKSFTNATVNGNVITLTRHNGDTVTITTQDTVYSHPTYTPFTGKPTINQTPDFGDIVVVSQITSDDNGHVTAMNDKTITIPATEATTSKSGLMSATDKTKLDGVEPGAEVNQNAFAGVKVSSSTIEAGSKTDVVELVAGNAITLTVDAAAKRLTVAVTDSTFETISHAAATYETQDHAADTYETKAHAASTYETQSHASATYETKGNAITGLSVSGTTVTYTKGDGTTGTFETQDHDTIYTHPSYTARTGKPTTNQTPGFGDTVTVSQVKSDGTGHVTAMNDKTITIPEAEASQNAHGLMSVNDKKKLDGISPSDYVLKTGDTVSGTLYFSTVVAIKKPSDDSQIQIQGSTVYDNGAVLTLFGKDNSPNAGRFHLRTGDGSGSSPSLSGSPSGALEWNGKNVACVDSYSSSVSGYIRLTNGIQLVWGGVNIPSGSESTGSVVTFAKPFSSTPRIYLNTNFVSKYGYGFGAQAIDKSTTGFTAVCGSSSGGTTSRYSSGNLVYLAVGPWAN